MTTLLAAGVAAAVLVAIVNWYAVARGFARLERPSKVAVPAILIALTLLSGPVTAPGVVLLIAALGASLAGDCSCCRPSDSPADWRPSSWHTWRISPSFSSLPWTPVSRSRARWVRRCSRQ